MNQKSWREVVVAGLGAAVLVLGCRAPERRPSADQRAPTPIEEPAPVDPTASAEPAQGESQPRPRPQPQPAEQGPKTVKLTGAAPTVVVRGTFPPEVLKLESGDRVEVQLRSRGRLNGQVVSVGPPQLTIKGEDGTMVRLSPRQVVGVRLAFRANDTQLEAAVPLAEPRNPRESWLPQFAPWEVLDRGDLTRLWESRFARNVVLPVRRAFEVPRLDLAGRSGQTPRFAPAAGRPALFDVGDLVKLAGVTAGLKVDLGGEQGIYPTVYLVLRKRGQRIDLISTTQPPATSNFDPQAVEDHRKQEPVYFAVVVAARDGQDPELRPKRVRASTAFAYMRYLDRLPDPIALRRLRAQDPAGLEAAEGQILDVYERLSVEVSPDEQPPRLLVELEYPLRSGPLGLVRYRKQLGFD